MRLRPNVDILKICTSTQNINYIDKSIGVPMHFHAHSSVQACLRISVICARPHQWPVFLTSCYILHVSRLHSVFPAELTTQTFSRGPCVET